MKKALVCVLALGMFLSAGEAFAQGNGFVRGLGGITFGTAETDGVYSGSLGVTVAPGIQIIGEVGRMQNVLSSDWQDLLDNAPDWVDVDVKVPAFYVTGGARVIVPTGVGVRPYVEGALGIARTSYEVDATVGGINLDGIVDEFFGGDSDTNLLLNLGGGLAFPLAPALDLEVGYRYGRIFIEDAGLNTNTVYGAVAIKF